MKYLATGPWMGTYRGCRRVVCFESPVKPDEIVVAIQSFIRAGDGKMEISTGSGSYYSEQMQGYGNFVNQAYEKFFAECKALLEDHPHAAPAWTAVLGVEFAEEKP